MKRLLLEKKRLMVLMEKVKQQKLCRKITIFQSSDKVSISLVLTQIPQRYMFLFYLYWIRQHAMGREVIEDKVMKKILDYKPAANTHCHEQWYYPYKWIILIQKKPWCSSYQCKEIGCYLTRPPECQGPRLTFGGRALSSIHTEQRRGPKPHCLSDNWYVKGVRSYRVLWGGLKIKE